MKFRAPKYSCSICNKTFRRRKQHFNHVMNAHKNTRQGTNKKQIVVVIEPELVSLKPEIEHTEPHPLAKYYGSPRLPFATDPLRRTLQPKILPKSMSSLGPIPRLSKYRSQAI